MPTRNDTRRTAETRVLRKRRVIFRGARVHTRVNDGRAFASRSLCQVEWRDARPPPLPPPRGVTTPLKSIERARARAGRQRSPSTRQPRNGYREPAFVHDTRVARVATPCGRAPQRPEGNPKESLINGRGFLSLRCTSIRRSLILRIFTRAARVLLFSVLDIIVVVYCENC